MTDRPFREHEFLAPADASPARHSITYSDILDLIVQNASLADVLLPPRAWPDG